MTRDNSLFPTEDPLYKEHLTNPGDIKTFKEFEDYLTELKFCKLKLSEAKAKQSRAMQIAAEPYAEEITTLTNQVSGLSNSIELYALSNSNAETKKRIELLTDVEIEEIHKVKIKFKKGDKRNVSN